MKYIIAAALVAFTTPALAMSLSFTGDQYSNEHTTTIGVDTTEEIMVGIGKNGMFYLGQDGQTLMSTGIVFDKSFEQGYEAGYQDIDQSEGWKKAVAYMAEELNCDADLAFKLVDMIKAGDCGQD